MGEMNSPQMSVNMSATGNQSKEEIFALNDEIMNRLLEIEDVETVGAISGGLSTLGNSSLNSDTSDETLFYILLKNDRSMTNIDVERLIYENTRDLEAELEVRSSNMDLSVLGGSGIQVMITWISLQEYLMTLVSYWNIQKESQILIRTWRILIKKHEFWLIRTKLHEKGLPQLKFMLRSVKPYIPKNSQLF